MNLTHTFPARIPLEAPEPPTVCVVDGDATWRETLGTLIRNAGWQTRMAGSAEEFLAWPNAVTTGCLLVDLHLPGMSGLALQRAVLDRTELPVIFMATHADIPSTVQAMKAGAFEFLAKPLVQEYLLNTIALAIERSQAALRQLGHEQALQRRYESLTCREREVLRLVIAGRLNKQVGGELGISEITVKAHRGKVMRKMQAGSFAELVNMAASLLHPHAQRLSNYLAPGMNARPS